MWAPLPTRCKVQSLYAKKLNIISSSVHYVRFANYIENDLRNSLCLVLVLHSLQRPVIVSSAKQKAPNE